MKKALCVFFALCLGLGFGVPISATPAEGAAVAAPSVSARAAILICPENDEVLFEKDADTRLGPASTTKLMTALVTVALCELSEVVSVSPLAVGIEGSSVYLVAGERLTVEELLYALLLSSANDAATALAIHAAGDVASFVARMNERAAELGLTNTHFTNPHGLSDEEHYTSARDLAAIGAAVWEVPCLARIVSTYKRVIPQGGVADRRLLVNHNKLLRTYEGALGMKTGYTKKTGRTLVSAAEREDLTLLAVTLNAPDDWRDHTAMLDYGFSLREKVVYAEAGAFSFALPVTGGVARTVSLCNREALSLVVPKERGEPHYAVYATCRFLFAPTDAGDEVGTVTLVCEGRSVSSPLYVGEKIAARDSSKRR